MIKHTRAPLLTYALGALCIAAIVIAFLVVGPPSQSAASSRIVTAQRGVVQATVSGSGNLAAGSQANLNFKTSGQLQAVYVKVGQHVTDGQLLAALDSEPAQASLDEAQDNLSAAEDRLQQAETAASSSTPASGSTPAGSSTPASSSTPATSSSSNSHGSNSGTSSGSSTAASASSNAGNVASARATVDSAAASLRSAQQALAATKLYASTDGAIAAISTTQPGNTVSAGSDSGSSADSSSSSSASSGSGSGGVGGSSGSSGSGGASSGANSSSSGSGSGNSSSFITIVNTSSMDLLAPFSESDINKIRLHQPATVTVNALPNEKLAAHVSSISLLSSTSSGVVSYDVTLHLDQSEGAIKPGMTAAAQIVVSQAENAVNLTSSAISSRGGGSTVTLLRSGKQTQQTVVTGIVGDSTTQILSGLKPGDQVVVPVLSALAAGSGSSSGTTGRAGFGGAGAIGGLGGGGARVFGGGGGGFAGGGP
ncbi:MAG TPA: biotin/lipoyl-binding protein [Solirubrobacteraceae bacterium]|nr:biotin/lipoyl-binding protein [Solirubrobacteraceae bacterium]